VSFVCFQSLTGEWLAEKRKQYGKDPAIMESMIYALYLLEQLKLTELDFIFKGGTSLILILEQPKRFSVDIDIIVSPKTTKEELEKYLSKIVGSSAFTLMRLDERRSYKEGVPKAHYIFNFQSSVPTKNKDGIVLNNPEREILLDVLFAENYYPTLVEQPSLK
jgi:predicted nucleotidyltransferase component of viral defense system